MVIGMYFLLPDQALFYFNAGNIARGETWRILTGHFMHSDLEHLFWNGLGLVALGTLIEHRSRKLLLAALGAGIVSVSILLMTPYAQLEYYCGLSGVLNSLLLLAIWLEWRATGSWLVITIACGSIAKVVIELLLGLWVA
jgi:rhomboid family GlyGly-CTERM serine protease